MKVNFLIVGQGIAGSTLALRLLERDQSVLVVDRQDVGSSTRVAAGLVTPLTGKGMNPAWQQSRCLAEAEIFYHQLELKAGRKFYHNQPVVRIFTDEKQRTKWERKKETHGGWASEVDDSGELSLASPLKFPFGSIEMPAGAWLDTKAFLHEVQELLRNEGAWREDEFFQDEVVFEADHVTWKDVTADKVILCQGAYGLGQGGWYGDVPHRSAKGEVLTIWLDGIDESKRYHSDGWIAPRGGGVWKAGANYDWDQLDSVPTDEGKDEILAKLRKWIDIPIEVIGHEAGVRPIIRNSQPLIGLCPDQPQVGFFNGLGSKGTLMAPAVADHFAAYLCGECALDEELDLTHWLQEGTR